MVGELNLDAETPYERSIDAGQRSAFMPQEAWPSQRKELTKALFPPIGFGGTYGGRRRTGANEA
jgi:hypothetical protein